MGILRNERGVALLTALMLTLISLAIIMALLYYVTVGTQQSAAYRRYSNVREATEGGGEFFSKELLPQVFSGSGATALGNTYPSLALSFGSYTSSLKQKVNKVTTDWGSVLCDPNSTVPNPKIAPDVTLKLSGLPLQPKFKVYAKIVDTVPGNSDTSSYGAGPSGGYLDNGSSVSNAGSSGNITPIHVPALLTIEVEGERESNALEKSKMSILYAF